MIEYDENVVHGLGQAHRCGRVKIVTDEKIIQTLISCSIKKSYRHYKVLWEKI